MYSGKKPVSLLWKFWFLGEHSFGFKLVFRADASCNHVGRKGSGIRVGVVVARVDLTFYSLCNSLPLLLLLSLFLS